MNTMWIDLRKVLLLMLLIGSSLAGATESFLAGVYKDPSGNQYVVSGPAPSVTGRAMWSITSTVPAPGKMNAFNAVWETGAAAGNSLWSGYSLVPNNPGNFPAGRSYGMMSNNDWTSRYNTGGLVFGNGAFISVSQVGNNLSISPLTSNGSIYTTSTWTYVAEGGVLSGTTSQSFLPGIYRDAIGNHYVVSGPFPSGTGYDQWTIASSVPATGISNTFNATWETGAASGNSLWAGTSIVQKYPTNFPVGRSYGIMGNNNWTYRYNNGDLIWGNGKLISIFQVGNNLYFATLNSTGTLGVLQTWTREGDTWPAGNFSDMWSSPAESGWGMSIVQHTSTSGQLFAVWFTYDTNNHPMWFMMSGGSWSGNVFTAAVYQTSGPSYTAASFDPNNVHVNPAGTATLTFADTNNGTFAYTVNGVTGTKDISRLAF
jgi:hypothetical protein